MDGLSAAASVMAVASLAFQLAECTKKMFEFWDSVQSAPEEIDDIKSELEFLTIVFSQVGREAQHDQSSLLTLSILRSCSRKINTIQSQTTKFEAGLTSSRIRTRKYSALRAVLSRDKIEKVQSSLHRLKTTLILALCNNIGRSSRIWNEHHDRNIDALTHRVISLDWHSVADQDVNHISNSASIDAQLFGSTSDSQTFSHSVSNPVSKRSMCPSSCAVCGQAIKPNSSTRNLRFKHVVQQDEEMLDSIFGTFRMSRRVLVFYDPSKCSTCSEQDDRFKYENKFTLTPPRWLARFGFTNGLSGRISSSSFSGPTVALDAIRSIPDDAEIFDLCKRGNLDGVQGLLSCGQASVKDVDSQGRTPLYFAAESCHADLCKLLIRYGADRDSRVYDNADVSCCNVRNPLYAIAYNKSRYETMVNPVQVIDTLRLFIDLVDVLNLEDDDWTSGSMILRLISGCHRPGLKKTNAEDVFLWALEKLGPDQWQSFDEALLQDTFFWCLVSEHEERKQRFLELCPDAINARDGVDGYTLLHQMVIYKDSVGPLLVMGANIHKISFDSMWSPEHETPISLSVYRADTFIGLQQALKNIGSKFEDIFNQEWKTFPWIYSLGKETLVELFSEDWDLSAIHCTQRAVCPYCLYAKRVMVQPYWMRILESIRNRIRPQRVKDVVEMMLSTTLQSAAKGKDNHGRDETCLPVQIQTQNPTDPDVEGFDIDGEICIEDESICLRCWQECKETGITPLPDQSKCLDCERPLAWNVCWGRDPYNALYCFHCGLKHPRGKQRWSYHPKSQRVESDPPAEIDSDEEEDDFSPYLIHT